MMSTELSPAMLRLIEALAQQAYREDTSTTRQATLEEEYENRENFVYRYFDRTGRLLYVGVTNEPENRHRGHRRKSWFSAIARKTVDAYPTRSAALAAEREALRTESPLHNGTPRADQ